MKTQKPILEVINLKKSFKDVMAVNGISFQIMPGICFGLLGPNGAGKTTTIEMIEGISKPDSGEIRYQGTLNRKTFKLQSGIQFQNTILQDNLNVRENLKLFHTFYPNPVPLPELIELCALHEFLNQDTRKISGGQKQRLLLALALINDPQILFLDEPTVGLDPQARRNFWDLIFKIKAKQKTIILTTHYMEEADLLCDEIAIVDKGQILTQGSPKALVEQQYDQTLLTMPSSQLNGKLENSSLNIQEKNGHITITTQNVNETLSDLIQEQVPLHQLTIRKPTLEDLFLDLTGHSLRE